MEANTAQGESSKRITNYQHDVNVEDDAEKRNWRPLATCEYDPVKVASINGIGTFAHDRAVIRALQSTYKPGDEIPEQAKLCKTLMVAKLPPLAAEEDVERLFSKFGKVSQVKVIRDLVTRRSKGYGFVCFEKERHCRKAYEDGKGLNLGGQTIIVDKALSRSMPGWKPRRLGGGFGGSKDSGQLRFGCKAHPWLRPTFKSERRLNRKAFFVP